MREEAHLARLYRANGTSEALQVDDDGLTLEQMQALVGGDIEVVVVAQRSAHTREVLIVNGDGHRLNLPFNAYATIRYQGYPPKAPHAIVGDVIEALLFDPGLDTERFI